MKYVIIGSAFSGNKGAASMLEAALQTISERDNQAEFTLLSIYPSSDRKLNGYKNLAILPTKPVFLGAILNPLALLYKTLPPLRRILRKQQHIRAIAEADVYIDQGGITFVDGRKVFLLYNIASILPGLLIGTPVVKCSQAMGPFKSGINRFFAKLILPRITRIYARGQKTHEFLQRLNISNVELVTDYAFSMNITKPEAILAHELLKKRGYDKNRRNVGVFPSEVLRKKAGQHAQNYEEIIAEFINTISVKDTTVYLVPHSQQTSDKRHNNDLPVCRDIYRLVKNKKHCIYLKEPTSSQQLRYIIGSMDINVVARFHAMVSSLAMSTPVLVTGWNHKYQEVLDIFELSECASDVCDLSTKNLVRQFDTLYAGRITIQDLIKNNLKLAKESSKQQADGIVLLAKG